MSVIHLRDRMWATSRLALLALAVLPLTGCGSSEDRAKSYYDEGMKLMASHDNARAAVEFKNAIKAKKDYIPAWQALAKIEEINRNWTNVVPILRTVVELDPKDIADKLKLSRLLLVGGASDEALKLINDIIQTDDRNADALALKAAVLFRLKDSNGAAEAAHAALDIDPKNSGAMLVLAAGKLARGDDKGALKILDDASAQKDDLGIDLFKLSILEQTKDLQQEEALLRRLAELYPTEPAFRKQLVRLYVVQHRVEDAIKEQKAIVAALPNDQTAELDLVRLLNVSNGASAARQELTNRIAAGGNAFPYQIALAEFDFAHGDFDSSVEILKNLISEAKSPEDVLAAQIRLAEFYFDKKQIEPAEALVSDILRKDARNTSGLSLRASIRMNKGEVEAAINDLREALNDQPRSVELILLLASAYERSGSMELAEKQYADAMRVANFAPNAGLAYVGFLERRGNIARTEDVLTELANRWPQNVQILTALAQVKLQRQDWLGAQEIADNVRRAGNNAGAADEIRGLALAGQNKYDESISALQGAYAALPLSSQPMAALVETYIRAKQPEKAVAFLDAAIKANPANADAYALLGFVDLATKKPDAALNNFNTAIAKDPKNINGYRGLANFYLSQQKLDEAQAAIRTGLKQQPDNGVLHLMLASTLELQGNFDGAIAEYQAMFDKDPGSLIAANNLASLLADHHTDKASLDRAQTLAQMLKNSPVPQFKDTLGWVDYQKGNYSESIRLIDEAATALPNRAVIHYHLGMAYLATNQLAKAAKQLNTALNQSPDEDLKAKIQSALQKTSSQ